MNRHYDEETKTFTWVYHVREIEKDMPEIPGTDGPGTDGPGTDEPGTDEPGTDGPGSEEPGTDKPETPGTDGGTDGAGQSSEDSKESADKAGLLPETGEVADSAIFGAAALSILAGLGFVATPRKREED